MRPPSPDLAASYELCRRLHARHGRTYYLATALLPAPKRRAVHALYGFARYVDDIVDVPLHQVPDPARIERVRALLAAGLRDGSSEHPVLAATVDTVRRFAIDPALLDAFLDSMALDLLPQRYATWTELRGYTWGSAAVIGLQLVAVLGTVGDPAAARTPAAALGDAFQITNFCRDYDEDRSRGRVYLPEELFEAHGVTPGCADGPGLRAVIADAVRYARDLYAVARPGVALLDPDGRASIATAFTLYEGILDEIEASGYAVVGTRHRVGNLRRLRVALPALSAAYAGRLARRARPTWSG